MPTFIYKARDLRGRLVAGRVEAENRGAASATLRSRGLFAVELRPARTRALPLGELFGGKVGTQEMSVFCRQFATMSTAGVPLLRCLYILTQQTKHRLLKRILAEVTAEVERGRNLSEAFRVHRARLPEVFTNMLAAGEVSGTLDETLERLAAYFEKEHALREKIKTAMTYPLIIAGVALVAIIVLLTFVVPTFAEIFHQMGATLPLATQLLIKANLVFRKLWYLFLLFLVALFFGLRELRKTKRGRKVLDELALRVPVLGPLVAKAAVARFARTLATLLRSGVPLMQALETVERVAGNAVLAAEVAAAREGVREGERISPAFAASKVFPPMAVSMLAVGEESGAVDELLEKVAVFYEQEVEVALGKLASTIEPLLIAVMGGLVAFMALAIYLPIFGMAGALQGGMLPGGAP